MPDSFEEQATQFADEVGDTLAQVLPGCVDPLELQVTGAAAGFITTTDEDGIRLTVAGKPVLRLSIGYKLTVDASQQWLKVLSSNFSVVPDGKGTPFFRYDFDAEARRVPAAHLNIHAHRDDLIAALVGSGKSLAAKNRRRGFVSDGKLPRVSSFHFPVGGPLFRPCLEDVLEAAIEEFGLDAMPEARSALAEGRARFRRTQLHTAIRRSPDLAADLLDELGYVVSAPDGSERRVREDWLRAP
ncbi:hypothetical protein USB125703_00166 [Pseudoclavibacter triregionum]|nr:hypothetical protein USB125703_00166 [Pseudoclavibacter triregionum]